MSEENEQPDPFADKVGIVRRPVWMRIAILIFIVLIAGVAFYFTNQITIERVQNR